MCHLVFVCLLVNCVPVESDVFTSTAVMERLLKSQVNIMPYIEEYIEMEQNRLRLLKLMAEEYERNTSEWLKGIDASFFGNPVATYLIIKHIAQGWIDIEQLFYADSLEDVSPTETVQMMPNETDVHGAAAALIRLQNTYHIDTDVLANGYLPGVPSFSPMSAEDCFNIGVVAYDAYNDYYAIQWFQESLKRINMEQPSPSMEESFVIDHLAFAFDRQRHYAHAYLLAQRLVQLRPKDKEADKSLSLTKQRMIKNGQSGLIVDANYTALPSINVTRNDSIYNDKGYEALCRGEGTTEPRGLSCYFKMDNPFLRLAPIKVEIVHTDPDILRFPSIISARETSTIQSLAAPRLQRSEVADVDRSYYADYRISQGAWLNDEAHPVLDRLARRVGDMTNLDMEYAEEFQVANYGLGGHYETHHDSGLYYMKSNEQDETHAKRYSNPADDRKASDRIATALIYLNQPVSGGATVFTELNVTIFPIAGDAIFWYNVLRNGRSDNRLAHGGCPVLAGKKWIINKWITLKNQELLYPCVLNPKA